MSLASESMHSQAGVVTIGAAAIAKQPGFILKIKKEIWRFCFISHHQNNYHYVTPFPPHKQQ